MQTGQELPSIAKRVTQGQIISYAEASGDLNPVHWDENFAKTTQFGRTIAHGMLVLAFVSEMMTRAFGRSWIKSGKLRIRFKAPVFPGEVVHTFGTVRRVEKIDGATRVQCIVGCRNPQNEEVVMGDAELLLPSSIEGRP